MATNDKERAPEDVSGNERAENVTMLEEDSETEARKNPEDLADFREGTNEGEDTNADYLL